MRKTTPRSGRGKPRPLFYAKKSKRWQKYVDYRKRFKYSVSDGSILAYYNGADYTFTWEQGRQLASVTKGSKTASYTYDMSGVRSSKTVNGVSYEYTTLSGKITRMTWSGNAVDIVYDDAGRPYLLRYTPSGGATQTYYYVLNLQGDVVGLMNTSMQMVVKYSYDPWGKLTGTTATSAYVALAQANPLRYRSYCYDIETGFYYLQTRYYDPAIARFINADGYLSTDVEGLLSANMFAYCENNPVTNSDPTGEFLDTIFDVISLAVSVAEVIACPADPMAWVGLAGDVVDLVPFVTGVGETIRGARTVAKVADKANTAAKAAKAVDNTSDVVKVAKNTKKLHRPYIRKSTREAVEAAAGRAPDGRFLDAHTGKPINGKYDLGHITGHEFFRERNYAMANGWTQKQFNDYMNDPSLYQIEDPILNRSHIYELKD